MVLPVNAWNTADRYVVPYRRDPLATDGLEPARQETCGFPSAVELRLSASVFRSAKSSCMVPDAAMMCPQKMELTLEPRNPPSILRAILIWWTEVFHQ